MVEFKVSNCFECSVAIKPHSFSNTYGDVEIGYESVDEIEYEVFLRRRFSLIFNDSNPNELEIYNQLRHSYEEDGAPFAFALDSDDGGTVKVKGYVVSFDEAYARDIIDRNVASVYAFFLDKRRNK